MAEEFEYSLMTGRAYQSTRNKKNWFPVPNGWTEIQPVGSSLFHVGSLN